MTEGHRSYLTDRGCRVGRRVLLGLTTVVLAWGTVAGQGAASAAPAAPARQGPPAGVRAALDRIVADGVPGVIAYGRQDGREWRGPHRPGRPGARPPPPAGAPGRGGRGPPEVRG